MPIPHLSHKIHSPNDWKNKPALKKSVIKTNRRSFDFKKTVGRFSDISFRQPAQKFRMAKFKKLLPYLVVIFLFFVIAGIGAVAWFSKDLPDPNKLSQRDVAQSTKIYDRSGEHLLYEIHGDQKRTSIPLNEIPNYAIQATLTLEDQHFYEHGGFSLWGMFRGVVLRTLTGQRAQGGSTLTQQLIKNAVLGDERSITRKIKELVLSYRLEQKYSKDEILQMYFNEIPYGSTAYGIEAGAQTYFGKSARNLSLAEAAILAAMPQAPTYYSPWGSHTNDLYGRQGYALDQMVKLGYLSQEEAEAAKQEKLEFKTRIEGITAPHFVFFTKELLAEKYSDQLIEQGGFKIISTLDWELQKQAEEIIKEQVEKNQENYNAGNAALVAIDVKTGQILAMVGSKDFFDDDIHGQVNVATSPRQPGSSFKPIVYTAAFQKGFVPESIIYDLETVFKTETGEDYFPHDYDLKQRGPVSLRQALAGSLNIPAVKMIYLAGIDRVLDLADQLGYTTLKNRSRFGLSLVLGGGEVKLLEHVNAYATFARDGKKMPYFAILKMENRQGKVMEEYQEPKSQKVMEPDIARITTDILSDNNARAYIFGASNYLTLPDRPVAAKTGTTNDYHDAWTLGYTPQLAVGVWVGNSNNQEMKRGADGSVVAAPIWQKFMKTAMAKEPVENFIKPAYQIPDKPMLGGDASGIKVTLDKQTGLLATEATPVELREEKIFKQTHTILYYINKEDPLGPAPQDPAQDPYFAAWEEPIQKWVQDNHIANELPPTEFDNVHRSEDRPSVSWQKPMDGQTVSQSEIQLQINTQANRGVQKVEYYIDSQLVGTSYRSPFDLNLFIPPLILNGQHNLTAKAYDDLSNIGQASLTINLDRPAYLNLNWLEPAPGAHLTLADFPVKLIINVDDPSKIKKMDFYYKKADDLSANWLGYLESPNQNNLEIYWNTAPASNTYKLYPLITNINNQAMEGPSITINLE